MPPISTEVLAELFPGQGVQIVDWWYGGAELSSGVFTGGMSTIGIDHGIILTSGDANLAPLPNMSSGDGISNNTPGDEDLDMIIAAATSDANSLTVVFKPISNEMQFNYAFASDEYIEYVGSVFNDAFGFFVSGPGIVGPYSNNAVNIALIPGTNNPVTINNVNHLSNEQFFNTNFGSNGASPSGVPPVYDGYTDVFSATLPVVPLEEYTLKIVLADAGDGFFDSAVFLEAESLSGGNDSLVASVSNSLYNPCLEGEAPASIQFDLTDFGPWLFPFYTTVSGTAEQGVDYELTGLPDSISLSQNVLEVGLEVFQDTEVEGIEQFTIEFESQGGFVFPYHFYINDGVAIPLNNITLCDGPQAVTLSAAGPTPGEAYEFMNEDESILPATNTAFIAELEVTNVPVNFLTDVSLIESVCLNIDHNWIEDLDIHLIAPGGQVLKLTTDNGGDCNNYENTCFSPIADERIDEVLVGNCGPSGEAPSTGTFLPEGNWDILEGTSVNGTWQLAIVDDNPGFTGTFIDWDITFNTQMIFEQPTFEWSTGETTESIEVMPTQTTTYSVTITQSGQTLEEEATIFLGGSSSTSEIASTHCESENYSITVNGTLYDQSNPMGSEVIAAGSFTGCDSTINVNLTYLPTYSTVLNTAICEGDCFTAPDGNEICVAGQYVYTLSAFNGCDSVITLDVTILEKTSAQVSALACAGDCVTYGGQTICETGIYEINSINFQGCDSTLTVEFTAIETTAEIAPPNVLDPINPSTVMLDGAASFATSFAGSTLSYSWSGPSIIGPTDGMTAEVDQAGNYCLTYSFAANGTICESTKCVDVVEGQAPLPNAPILNGPTLVCQNETAIYTATDPNGLTVDLTWTTPMGQPFVLSGANGVEVDWSGTMGGTICVVSTNSSGSSPEACLEVSVISEMTVANLSTETACDYLSYQVSFVIDGGDQTAYSVEPFGSGTISGNVFTSEAIPCGTDYSFLISDGTGCNEITIEESDVFCECLTETGLMDETPIEVCEGGGNVTSFYDDAFQLYDCDDVSNFILHNGDLVPIAVSATPEFGTNGLIPGEYFITAVVGNDDGSGFVDFTDPCLDFSNSAELIIHPAPTMSLEAPASVCTGEWTTVVMNFEGQAPFEASIETNGTPSTLFALPASYNLFYEIEEDIEVILLEATDANGCSTNDVTSVQVEAQPLPDPAISFTSPVCPGTSDAIQLEFNGAAPYYISYTLNGTLFFDSVPGNLLELGANINSDTEFSLTSSIGANGCSSGELDAVLIETIPTPDGSASFNGPLCPGFDLELNADGGSFYEWIAPDGELIEMQSFIIENINADETGTYELTVTNDCGDTDVVSVDVEFECEVLEETVLIGQTEQICFDEIVTSADLCEPVSAIEIDVDGNCLNFTGLSEGVETVCLVVVLDGQEVAVTVEINSTMSTSVTENGLEHLMNIYPNPNNGLLTLDWESLDVESVRIHESTGRLVEEYSLLASPSNIDLEHLTSGVYLLHFQTSKGVLTKKLTLIK